MYEIIDYAISDNDVISGSEGHMQGFRYILENIHYSVFITIMVFVALFLICFISSKVRYKAYHTFAAILAACVTIGFILLHTTSGSVAMQHLSVGFIMTATVFILNFVKLSIFDYSVMFACFTWLTRFAGFEGFFGVALPTLYVFIAMLVIYKIRLTKLSGHLFYVWFASVFTAVVGYIVSVFFWRVVVPIGQPLSTDLEKILVWGIVIFFTILMNLALIYAIKRLFNKHFDEINQMGKAYPKIERFFIYNSTVILLLIVLLIGYYSLSVGSDNLLINAFNLFSLIALIIQFSFLLLFFRISWLKDSLKNTTMENQSLVVYSSALEKNIDDIKNIKHDIKNIFLTMGRFVEQSDNEEMQKFYRDIISPFAYDEIAKSDLYGKLIDIDNEQLKAFLFYKASQAIERGITLDLDISVQFSVSKSKIEFTDLVRILGILLDNAIEECMEIADSSLSIKISQNDELVSYAIKNTVRGEMKEKGIKAGVSTKGSERGKGLIIGRGILEKYDFITLNSFFQDGFFVQNLVLYNI